jgi:hypothetical protein
MNRTLALVLMVFGLIDGAWAEEEKEFKVFNYKLGMMAEDVPCTFSLRFDEGPLNLPPFYECKLFTSPSEFLVFDANPKTKQVVQILRTVLLNKEEYDGDFLKVLINLYGPFEEELPSDIGMKSFVWGDGTFKYWKRGDFGGWEVIAKNETGDVLQLNGLQCENLSNSERTSWSNRCNVYFDKADNTKVLAELLLYDESMRKSYRLLMEEIQNKQ